MHARGQLFSSDALLAMVVFLFALTVTFMLTDQLVAQTTASAEGEQLNHITDRLAQTLIFSPGNPSNWEYISDRNNVVWIGLVSHGKEITPKKLSSFRDWNANDFPSLKSNMGIKDKNFYFFISDVNKNVISTAGTSPINALKVSTSTFSSTYRGKPVLVTLQVYES
jgi:hypothetical protein